MDIQILISVKVFVLQHICKYIIKLHCYTKIAVKRPAYYLCDRTDHKKCFCFFCAWQYKCPNRLFGDNRNKSKTIVETNILVLASDYKDMIL